MPGFDVSVVMKPDVDQTAFGYLGMKPAQEVLRNLSLLICMYFKVQTK